MDRGGKKRRRDRPRFSSGHLIAAHYCTQDVHGRQKVCPNRGTRRTPGAGYARRPVNAIHYHNRMTRAARAENPPASFPRRGSHNGADRKPQLREPRYSVELN